MCSVASSSGAQPSCAARFHGLGYGSPAGTQEWPVPAGGGDPAGTWADLGCAMHRVRLIRLLRCLKRGLGAAGEFLVQRVESSCPRALYPRRLSQSPRRLRAGQAKRILQGIPTFRAWQVEAMTDPRVSIAVLISISRGVATPAADLPRKYRAGSGPVSIRIFSAHVEATTDRSGGAFGQISAGRSRTSWSACSGLLWVGPVRDRTACSPAC